MYATEWTWISVHDNFVSATEMAALITAEPKGLPAQPSSSPASALQRSRAAKPDVRCLGAVALPPLLPHITASKTADANAANVAVRNRIVTEVNVGMCTFVGEAGTLSDNYGEPEDDLVLENANNETAPDAADLGQWTKADCLSGGGGDASLTVYEDTNPAGLLGTTSVPK